jgi:hypothetical protein
MKEIVTLQLQQLGQIWFRRNVTCKEFDMCNALQPKNVKQGEMTG